MKLIKLLTLLLVTLLFYQCAKDEIDTYKGESYVYFARKGGDALEYSFSFHPGKDTDTIPLVIKLIGHIAERDRKITLVVNSDSTTALSADFALPANIVLPAGKHIDTIALVLVKSPKLLENKFRIYLELKESEDFKTGPVTNVFADIVFSDMLSRPAWWDALIVSNFLGTYSDAKYRLFIEATGVADLTDMSESEKRAYAQIFRDFLKKGRDQGNIYVDEFGNPITVPEGLFS